MFDWPHGRIRPRRESGAPHVIILGIDPGLANTGWGVIETVGSRHRCVAYGCIATSAEEPIPDRLARVHREVAAVIARYHPAECAVENVYFSTNAKSAFATGQARGVALLAMADAGLVLGEYSPVQVKSAVVGSGAAEKHQIAYMMRVLLGLDHEPTPDHAADALAVAVCHAHRATGPAARAREAAYGREAPRADVSGGIDSGARRVTR